MTQHLIHATIPDGFVRADRMQVENYSATGSVDGASKVALYFDDDASIISDGDIVKGVGLAVRLRPPFKLEHITIRPLIANNALALGLLPGEVLDWYIREYNNGWQASRRGRGDSVAFDRGSTTHAWDDGYLDRASDRPKWHLTWCVDHDSCGEA